MSATGERGRPGTDGGAMVMTQRTVEPVGTGDDEAMWYRGCTECGETGVVWTLADAQEDREVRSCETCSGRGFVWVALDDILAGINPALPAIARWLAEHFDDDKTVAVANAVEGVQQWIDGLKDNGTHEDMLDAESLARSLDVLRSLVAALAGEPQEDGNA